MAVGGTPSPRVLMKSAAEDFLSSQGYDLDKLSLLWASGDIDILMKATFGFRYGGMLIYIEVKALSGGRMFSEVISEYDWDNDKHKGL